MGNKNNSHEKFLDSIVEYLDIEECQKAIIQQHEKELQQQKYIKEFKESFKEYSKSFLASLLKSFTRKEK
jgi:hypothetical protein